MASVLRSILRIFNPISSSATVSKANFLDPGNVITTLALLSIERANGHYLSILKFNQNSVELGRQNSDTDTTLSTRISDLETALFYAVQWFQPKDTPKYPVLFQLAINGLGQLKLLHADTEIFEICDKILSSEPATIATLKREDLPLLDSAERIWNSSGTLSTINTLLSSVVEDAKTLKLKETSSKKSIDAVIHRIQTLVHETHSRLTTERDACLYAALLGPHLLTPTVTS
ncbi:MAG: hypothetical protein K9M07_03255 [Simkaniaceae bacterium]|nr:hypothetical protein [Simkaniaceae bacterium]